MRTIAFTPDAAIPFTYATAPEPRPGPGQVAVRTSAVGVGLNLLRMLRAGTHAGGPGPGGEVVGRVTATGPGVTGFAVGDRVGGLALTGAYAETVLAVPALLTPLPDDLPTADALALVRGGLVALGALTAAGPVRGRSVLVTGAASGAGHLAVQLACAYGAARVTGAVGAADKAGFVRGLGAAHVVTYDAPSWGDPADVVLDSVGGDLVQRGVDALAPRGRLVAYGAGGGMVAAATLLAGHKAVTGFSMGLVAREHPETIAAHHGELRRLYATGALRPAHTAFPFTGLAPALRLIEERRNHGRVLLTLGDS